MTVEQPLLVESGQVKDKNEVPTRTKVLVIVACILLVVLTAVIAVTVVLLTRPATFDYGIIIDAGSSGSRIYVYKWPHRKDNSTIPVVTPVLPEEGQGAGQNSVKPGIAQMHPENVSDYLQPLFDFADVLVPDRDKPRTPIFFFATAGMRLLPVDKQNQILNAVRTKINGTTYDFSSYLEWSRVITGAEEGVFGWVTANYLKEILFKDDAKDHAVGALDLGGASLQITFLPKEKPKENMQSLILPKNVFDLYTYSFLSYGQDQTLSGVTNITIENENKTGVLPTNIPFPCFLRGYSENITIEGGNYSLVGSGDFELCAEYERQYMNLTGPCEVEPCSMDGVYQPKVTGEFYAMSGFFYTAQFFGFGNETKKAQPKLFKEYGVNYCNMTWEEAKKEHPKLADNLLRIYCFTSSYIYNVLTAGFGFGENETDIYFTDKINNTTLNWALGGLIAEASLLPK